MKRIIITGLFAITVITLSAQTKNNLKSNKFDIGFTFSPDYSYRFLTSDPWNSNIIDILDSYEIPKQGITTGVSIIYRFHNRFNLETGILFSDKGEKTKVMQVDYFNPDSGTIFQTHRLVFNMKYFYIDVPVKVNFNILNKNLKWFISAGFSTNFYLTTRTITLDLDNGNTDKSNSQDDFLKINPAVLIGTGLDYNFNDKLNLRFEPIYRQSVIAAYKQNYERFLYSVGINFGIYFKL